MGRRGSMMGTRWEAHCLQMLPMKIGGGHGGPAGQAMSDAQEDSPAAGQAFLMTSFAYWSSVTGSSSGFTGAQRTQGERDGTALSRINGTRGFAAPARSDVGRGDAHAD